MLYQRTALIIYTFIFLLDANVCLAANATASFNVTATVLDGCAVAATDMQFGTYVNTTVSTTTNTITVTCNDQTQYSISLSPGNNGGQNFTRSLISGQNLLAYNIHQDSAYTQIWGDGTGGSTIKNNLTANGSAQVYTAYGKIPPMEQEPAVGTYTDTITVTVNYN